MYLSQLIMYRTALLQISPAPVLEGLATALSQLGGLLPLAHNTGLLEEATPAYFRQYAVVLHLLLEPPQQGIEGLLALSNHPCHSALPPSLPNH